MSVSVMPLVSLDIETTGANVTIDRIVEMAIIRQEPGKTTEKVIRLNPGMPIHPMASQVHGITDADVAECPEFRAVASEVRDLLAGAVLLGFNLVNFDLPIIFRQLGEVDPMLAKGLDQLPVVDLMAVYHHVAPRNLDAASRQFLGKPLEGAHDALADTRCVLELLPAMMQAGQGAAPNLEAMAELTDSIISSRKVVEGTDGECYFRFGRHSGKSFTRVLQEDPSYFSWAASQAGMGQRARMLFLRAVDAVRGRVG